MTYEVYIPIKAVISTTRGLLGFEVDFEGAPWPYSDSHDNIWNPDGDGPEGEDEWYRDEEKEAHAITLLTHQLAKK